MLASLPVCPRSHCPTCCRHTHDGVHSHTRACSKAHLSMSSHMCPNYIDPQVPVVPTPGLSSTPFPSPTPALKLPFTLPTTPTFISAHRQAPTCSSSLSSPFHTQARLFLLTPSLGLNALAFQCTHTQAHSDACFTGSAHTWITKLVYIHTPNNPRACLVPQRVHPSQR